MLKSRYIYIYTYLYTLIYMYIYIPRHDDTCTEVHGQRNMHIYMCVENMPRTSPDTTDATVRGRKLQGLLRRL